MGNLVMFHTCHQHMQPMYNSLTINPTAGQVSEGSPGHVGTAPPPRIGFLELLGQRTLDWWRQQLKCTLSALQGAGGPRSRCPQGWALLRVTEVSVPGLFLSNNLWPSLPCDSTTAVCVWPFSCVSEFKCPLSHEDIIHIGLDPTQITSP